MRTPFNKRHSDTGGILVALCFELPYARPSASNDVMTATAQGITSEACLGG
jgi:hypothetical protein